MDGAVREALHRNPRLAAARFEADAARVQADREKPVARPTVTARATSLIQGPEVVFPRGAQDATVLPERYSRISLDVEQTVYHAGAAAAWRRYAASMAAADDQVRIAANDLVLEVRQAYLDLLTARAMKDVAEGGRNVAASHLSLVRRLVEAGLSAPRDVLSAQAGLAEAEEGLVRAVDGERLAAGNLNRLLARPADASIEVQEVSAEMDPGSPVAAGGAGSADQQARDAPAVRPETSALRNALVAAEAGQRLARSQSQPVVSVTASAVRQTRSAFVAADWYGVGLSLKWALADGGAASRDAREAAARLAQLRALLAEAEAGIALEVRSALADIRSADARVVLARSRVAAATSALEVSELRYEQRAAALLEVEAARLAVTSARAALVQARHDRASAEAKLKHATGADMEMVRNP